MPWFRSPRLQYEGNEFPTAAPTAEDAHRLAAEALRPAHFFLGPGISLEAEHVTDEEISWEVFHGRLLPPEQTRRWQRFEAWNLFLVAEAGRSGEPLLSLKLDSAAGQLHIVRALEMYVWEYSGGREGCVIHGREVRKWVRELTGTIPLAAFTSIAALHDEIICRLFQAVVGTSRLPLTSVEAPLPLYSLGRLAYFYRSRLRQPAPKPMRSYRDLIKQVPIQESSAVETAKFLETVLHAIPPEELGTAADQLTRRLTAVTPNVLPNVLPDLEQSFFERIQNNSIEAGWERRQALLRSLMSMFNEASLSPYTDLVDKTLAFVRTMEDRSNLTAEDGANFLSALLRQVVRHLTAYDLVTFHNRGANYPDALLLDAALKDYLDRIERRPDLFLDAADDPPYVLREKRLRRRALRQAWLLRRRYEGHPVPETPTSEGEARRVLPPPFERVPDEQIAFPHKRTKRLYHGDPLKRWLGDQARAVLRQSVRDLRQPVELRQLGMAVFVDRPFDAGKTSLEPDQTLLFSYLAFSKAVARQRLQFLAERIGLIDDPAEYQEYQDRLENEVRVPGLPVHNVVGSRRPTVSLADALRVADDFVFLRTTATSASQFFRLYDFGPLHQRFGLDSLSWGTPGLIVRTGLSSHGTKAGLAIYDARIRKRVALDFDPRPGYASRGGIEYPVSPLRVRRVWEEVEGSDELRECRLEGEELCVPACPDYG